MANYRRFVTYFYDYSSGNKGGICGFGKIEYSMRSRVHITIQGKRTGREECVVYGIGGNDEPNQTLGRFQLNYGKGSFLWEWNGKERNADLFVRNMVGIVLCINDNARNSSNRVMDNVWAATRWDGVEFDQKYFVRQQNQLNQQEELREEQRFERSNQQSEADNQIEHTVDDSQRKAFDECEKDSSTLRETGESDACSNEGSRISEQGRNDNDERYHEEKNTNSESSEESDYSNQTNPSSTLLQDNDIIWQQLCHKYAKFMPFPQSSHIQCLKIHLGDLRRFSGENRRLANNNFLLRGYYRCHYIVLSRWEMEDGAKYYIGIPGIYQEREEKLSSHFGFCVFAPFKGGDVANGKSGLWMTPLHLSEERI